MGKLVTRTFSMQNCQLQHVIRLSHELSLERGKLVTASQVVREAIEKAFPLKDVEGFTEKLDTIASLSVNANKQRKVK